MSQEARYWLIIVVALLLLGVLPYADLLHQVPWGPDAAKWVDRGALDDRHWARWVFETKHFIGYRPVAALTFVINNALTGYEPWGYRLTDILLHVGVGVLLVDLYRLLTGSRGLWGVAALLVLCGHPATEEVVPFVARRSYLLSAFFTLAACSSTLLALRASRPISWGWWAAVPLCTGLALFSNEGAFVLVGLLPLMVFHSRGATIDALRRALPLLPTAGVVVAVLARRVAVLGSTTGGYGKHYFAYMRDGAVMWRNMPEPDHLKILVASWLYTLSPHAVSGSTVYGLKAMAPLFFVSLVLILVVRPLLSWRDPASRTPLVLAVWLVGSTAIIVASGTWFWRQAYFLMPAIALGFAYGLRTAWADLQARRFGPILAAAPFLLGLPLGILATGPLLHGMDASVHQARIEYGSHVHTMRALTADLEGPGTLYIVLPAKSGAAHNMRIWSNRFVHRRQIVVKVLARIDNAARGTDAQFEVVDEQGRLRIDIDGTAMRWEIPRIGRVPVNGTSLYLDELYTPNRTQWVYTTDPVGVPVLYVVPPPPPSAPPR